MKRKTLEFQADQIEMVLARHEVPGRVTGGLVSPRWVKFDVLPALGARVSKVKGLAEELAPPHRAACGAGVAVVVGLAPVYTGAGLRPSFHSGYFVRVGAGLPTSLMILAVVRGRGQDRERERLARRGIYWAQTRQLPAGDREFVVVGGEGLGDEGYWG